MSLETDLEQIKQQGIEKIKEVTSEQQLNDLKVKFLGKKRTNYSGIARNC